MGINSCDSITAKYDICHSANRSVGYTADGEKVTPGFCETNLEKGMLAAGVAFPVWSSKGKIWNFCTNNTWSQVGQAYKQGFQGAWTTLRHPGNYSNLEFLNTKIGKIEGIMAKNMPQMPQFSGQNATQLEELFTKLCKAKNPKEYARIAGQDRALYKKLCNIVKRSNPGELSKLTQVAKYNELYARTLSNMNATKATIEAGGKLHKGQISAIHRQYANARLAENAWITAGKAGKKGVGMWAKGCAKMSKGVKTAMAASKTLRGASRMLGKAGGWIAAGLTLVCAGVDCYAAWQVGKQNGNEWSCLGRQALKSTGRAVCELGGAWAGAWAGAAIGQACIPIPGVGAVIGGIIGGFVGWWAGSKTADAIPGLDKSVAEEEMEKQAEQQKQALCKAIDENNWQAVMQYVEANKAPKVQVNEKGEPILDAEGNPQPVLDANGNQIFEYAQISDKPEEQKAFEAEIDRLQTWVEEKMVAAYEAEKVAADAEAKRQAQLAQYAGAQYGYGYGAGSTQKSDLIGYGYGAGSTSGEYSLGTGYRYGTTGSGYNWANNYSNLAYDFDNGKFDYMSQFNPLMMDYNSNIFTQKYGQQAA